MYLDGTIRTYLEDASSGDPTPGGGSVAALAGALGLSMACMAANFTVGKKKYKDVEPEVKTLLGKCAAARDDLANLMDLDTQAYGAVSQAYGMPKDTPEQKKARAAAIQQGLKAAMSVPLQAVRVCRDALEDVRRLVDIANPNLITDVGVAAILAEAALRAAKLNVEINLKFLKDEELVSKTREEIDAASKVAKRLSEETLAKVAEAVSG